MSHADLTVTISHSAGYDPSPRLVAAVEELQAAIHDHAGAEVTGFTSGLATGRRQYEPVVWQRPSTSSVFHTITWTYAHGGVTAMDDWQTQA